MKYLNFLLRKDFQHILALYKKKCFSGILTIQFRYFRSKIEFYSIGVVFK
ncbi:hypothetical protein GFO_2082 [Christiangramia forsetii KT0803]|uniref:Uncharacterized protein n=1 Tax=Christiangramia forsetii (strain DSM 17595 / CGMCC 1.15422 / KT0803) TaxID=411154 RepID=A0M352_CHRFK|nr:hypothetical protein GFO_2082 [Christiangramia forsetii KT0803]